MAKLTKEQSKAHAEAEKLLTKDTLTENEKDFVFQNWHEGADHMSGAAGAFFTPWGLAFDFTIDAQCLGRKVIDLCAGIGLLSYAAHWRSRWPDEAPELTCVEINPRYVEVGRKLLPEARWICADVFAWRDWWYGELQGEMFDVAIGNAPFGAVRRSGESPRYRGREFELHVIDIAAEMADRGTFIVPQSSAPFRYSGSQYYQRLERGKGFDFEEKTGFALEMGAGVDTAIYRDDWKDTSVICEIVNVEFAEVRARKAHQFDSVRNLPAYAPRHQPAEQLRLL